MEAAAKTIGIDERRLQSSYPTEYGKLKADLVVKINPICT